MITIIIVVLVLVCFGLIPLRDVLSVAFWFAIGGVIGVVLIIIFLVSILGIR